MRQHPDPSPSKPSKCEHVCSSAFMQHLRDSPCLRSLEQHQCTSLTIKPLNRWRCTSLSRDRDGFASRTPDVPAPIAIEEVADILTGSAMNWVCNPQVKTSRQEQQAVTDMKSLSGGERSFTNMCFIMAVGQQISSPFHCLDEFDVSL